MSYKPFKSHIQPLCRACGKPIKKHTEDRYFGRFSGKDNPLLEIEPKSRAEAQRYVNGQIVSVDWSMRLEIPNDWESPRVRDFIRRVTFWDGESYQDNFFCTNRCSMSYARMMAAEGDAGRHNIKSVAYADSLREQAGMKPR